MAFQYTYGSLLQKGKVYAIKSANNFTISANSSILAFGSTSYPS